MNLHLKSKIATDSQGQKKDNFTWKTPQPGQRDPSSPP
jgi:hypothetical protein